MSCSLADHYERLYYLHLQDIGICILVFTLLISRWKQHIIRKVKGKDKGESKVAPVLN